MRPLATFVLTDDDRKAHDGWGGGMGFGKILDQHFNIELKGFYQGYNSQNGRWSMSGGTADLQYYFSRDKFSPYTVIGLGGMSSNLGSKSTAGFIGEAGLGFSYELHDNLLIRSDVRYRYNNNGTSLQANTSDYSDMVVNLGFVIPFGEKPKAVAAIKPEAPAPVATPAPRPAAPADCSKLDADNDGVNDCLDKCPNTPKGSKVDNFGCPIKLILKGNQLNTIPRN